MNTYQIRTIHVIFEDNFNEGEGAYIHSFTLESTHTEENIYKAVTAHFQNLGYNIHVSDCSISECGEYMQTSCSVTCDNSQPSEGTLELWKKGTIELYIDHITVEAYLISRLPF